MAVDGSVDIAPILDKNRLDKRFHDGSAVAEGHDEFEAAMCEIFGIPLGASINSSIFGDFPRDRGGWGDFNGIRSNGAWTFCRFSHSVSVGNAANAVGWEFKDGDRRIRLCQVAGTIQIWEFVNGSWRQKINIEAIEEYALTQLQDVEIRASDLNANNEGLCPMVRAGSVWGLGEDTTVSGSETWRGLTDVHGTFYSDYGAPGSIWRTDPENPTIVRSHLLPGDVKIGASFSLNNYLIKQGNQPQYFSGWVADQVPDGYSEIEFSGEEFLFPTPGVYKAIFSYVMISGNTSAKNGATESLAHLTFATSNIIRWPLSTGGALIDEVWWKIVPPTTGRISPEGVTLVALTLLSDVLNGESGMHSFYFISKGGNQARMALKLYQNTELGDKIMNFHVSFERIS